MQRLIEELKVGSPAKENQPQSQQAAASASTGAKPTTAPGPSKPVLAPSRRNAQHSSSANRQAAMRQQLEVLFLAVNNSTLMFMWLLHHRLNKDGCKLTVTVVPHSVANVEQWYKQPGRTVVVLMSAKAHCNLQLHQRGRNPGCCPAHKQYSSAVYSAFQRISYLPVSKCTIHMRICCHGSM